MTVDKCVIENALLNSHFYAVGVTTIFLSSYMARIRFNYPNHLLNQSTNIE